MDEGRYVPIRGVHCDLDIIMQLTTFGTCNRVDSMSHPYGLSLMAIVIPPCVLPAAVGYELEHTTSYPRRFLH